MLTKLFTTKRRNYNIYAFNNTVTTELFIDYISLKYFFSSLKHLIDISLDINREVFILSNTGSVTDLTD